MDPSKFSPQMVAYYRSRARERDKRQAILRAIWHLDEFTFRMGRLSIAAASATDAAAALDRAMGK